LQNVTKKTAALQERDKSCTDHERAQPDVFEPANHFAASVLRLSAA